jgi:hypothetical protein
MVLIRGLVPILVVFTKFDLLVSRVHSDITHEDPRAKAHAIYEDLCRSQFHKDPKDVPAVIFSGNCSSVLCVPQGFIEYPSFFIFIEKPEYRGLIDELTSITHRFFKEWCRILKEGCWFVTEDGGWDCIVPEAAVYQLEPPIDPALLAWSVAQRANHEIAIQSSIGHVLLSSLSITI